MPLDHPLANRAASRIGRMLRGKYRLDRVIGIGGMAVVYAATHRNQKQFAVKMLHDEFSVRRDVHARFLREGYLANAVAHPGVVSVLDDDVDEDGCAFLVMELLEGATVHDLCARRGGRLPTVEAFGVIHQLLDVLCAAHAKGVIHRDVKPANLFVQSDGRLKVLDFGIARLRDASSADAATGSGVMLGTPAFMAPEQALGQAADIEARTDVWAAGATLFWMLSGRFVHADEAGRSIMIRAATQPAPLLGSVIADAPASVCGIVDHALAFDRGARWASAAAMRDAIGQSYEVLAGEPLRPQRLRSLFEEPSRSRTHRGTSGVPETVSVNPVPLSGSVSTTLRSPLPLVEGEAPAASVTASPRTVPGGPPSSDSQRRRAYAKDSLNTRGAVQSILAVRRPGVRGIRTAYAAVAVAALGLLGALVGGTRTPRHAATAGARPPLDTSGISEMAPEDGPVATVVTRTSATEHANDATPEQPQSAAAVDATAPANSSLSSGPRPGRPPPPPAKVRLPKPSASPAWKAPTSPAPPSVASGDRPGDPLDLPFK